MNRFAELNAYVAAMNHPSEAAKRLVEDMRQWERQRQDAFRVLGLGAESLIEPCEAAKRMIEDIARSAREMEKTLGMFDPSWLKLLAPPPLSDSAKRLMEEMKSSLSEPLKLYVAPEPTCRLLLVDQSASEGDDAPPCGGRRVGFHPWH